MTRDDEYGFLVDKWLEANVVGDPSWGEMADAQSFADAQMALRYPVMNNAPIADSALPAEENGWSREDVWSSTGGAWGDEDVHGGYSALYVNGNNRLDLAYYVQEHDGRYMVSEVGHTWTVDADGEPLDDDDYDYDHVSDVMFHDTVESALASCRRLALMDERWKLG